MFCEWFKISSAFDFFFLEVGITELLNVLPDWDEMILLTQ
jgi:hypothetical protein